MQAAGGTYRPDIDGLRAVAVLPVLLFHAGIAGFGGGYVGVDIFFVISGYLITTILVTDIGRGSYSIVRFYERRVRRIFPALVVVVATSLLLGWFVLTPAEYDDLGRSAVAVAGFVSNFYFWRSVDYFADAHAIQPLLHTWSLAVEEQFYIVFPPLLAWLARRKARVLPVMVAALVASLALAVVMVFYKPGATFYLPATRAWELLVGSVLATGRLPLGSPRQRQAGGIAGLLLCVVPIVLYTAKTPFPGAAAIPPVLGAALIIWAGMGREATLAGRLLAAAPMTFVGRISYSLYLWHVPVFGYAIYLTAGEHGGVVSLVAIAISFVLAWLTYRFVETPFRARPGAGVRHPVRWGVAGMAVTTIAAIAIAATHGMPARLNDRGARLMAVAGDKARFHMACMSAGDTIVPPARACRLGAPDTPPTALLWGDSHALVAATPMEIAARRRGAAFLFAAIADCPVGIGFSIDPGFEPELTGTPSYRYCAQYNRDMLQLAKDTPSIRSVVLAARWTNWRMGAPVNPAESPVDLRLRDATGVAGSMAGNAAIAARGLRALVAALTAAGKTVTIVGPLPEPRFNVPHRLFVQQFGLAPPVKGITLADYRRHNTAILRVFGQLDRDYDLRFIWPTRTLCRTDTCPIEDRGRVNFFDHNHLSSETAKSLASQYDPVFANDEPKP